MQLLRTHIFSGILLFLALFAASSAALATTAVPEKTPRVTRIKPPVKVEGQAELERRMEIYEHAAANRELAALTQMEHARDLQSEAAEVAKGQAATEIEEYKKTYKKAGTLEKSAAALYGHAAANFDKAAANRTMVAKISQDLGKAEQHRTSVSYSSNMKLRGDEAMRMAANACEAAAVAFDKADDPTEVAANSQMAATWLEKLAVR
jgi:hypothetical protein